MIARRWSALALGTFVAGVLVAPTTVGAITPIKESGIPATSGTLAASGTPAAVVTHQVSSAQKSNTIAYWTPARMRAAKSLDVIVRKAPPPAGQSVPATSGVPGAVAPSLPGTRGVSSALPQNVQGAAQILGFAYPFPFDRTAVFPQSLYLKAPWVVNGKLFFTQNGSNFVCSGTAVSATNLNEVWTAGHCVSDGAGHWNSSALFVPAYNGTASNCCPRGKFVANNFSTSGAWHSSHDFSLDLGAITVNPNGAGKQLQTAVGAAGFAWNWGRDQQYVDFGYPQAAPFDGQHMMTCLAATAVYDTGIGGAGQAPNGIGCDMTGGSSGGSWQILWGGTSGGSPGYINGHNDYKYGSQPLAMYSPYFDNTANAVRCALEVAGQNGC